MRAVKILGAMLLLFLVGLGNGAPAGAVTISEFPIGEGEHRPLYIAVSPLGTIWFADTGGTKALRAIDSSGAPLQAITSEYKPVGDLGSPRTDRSTGPSSVAAAAATGSALQVVL